MPFGSAPTLPTYADFKPSLAAKNLPIGAVADSRNDSHRLVRNFVGEIKTNLAIFLIDVAINRRFFNPDKSVYGCVADSDKVKIIFEKHNAFILPQENFIVILTNCTKNANLKLEYILNFIF